MTNIKKEEEKTPAPTTGHSTTFLWKFRQPLPLSSSFNPMAAMAAASLHSHLSRPNPNSGFSDLFPPTYCNYVLPRGGAYSSAQRCAVASGSVALLLQLSVQRDVGKNCYLRLGKRRLPRIVPFSVGGEDSKQSDVELDGLQGGIGSEKKDPEESWEQLLESFKQQSRKMQSLSQEAYEVYSKRAIIVLEETSRNMKIQADKARHEISQIAKEISDEGREYITVASTNSPDSVKDIVEIFSTVPDELSDLSKVRDFYLGIPYGVLLALGGFASFMFTGSTSAIRFGIILGSVILALSVSSLRAWRERKTSSLLLKGQTAIATIIFARECRLLLQKPSFPTCLMTIISGAMLIFFIYRVVLFRQSRGKGSEENSKN